MSIAALTQLYDEMRRLAIAGSNVAVGNVRLQKLIPPLEKSGEKAPVFAKVALATQAVVDSSEKTAPGAMLDLAALVNAILYTQGTTGIAGTLESIETTELGARQTQTSARMIKPLLAALTTTGSGRLETIRDAFERGAFGDLRLVKPALGALDDPYPEIADFIADKVLPVYGKAVLPELRRSFDLKGKGGHARRLKLMHELDPVGTREFVKQVLDDGSKELRVVAIECLGGSDEDLAFLLEQARSRAKEVRVSALRTLTKLDAAEAVEAVQNGAAGADLEHLAPALSVSRNPDVMKFVLSESEQQFDKVLKLKSKKEQGAAIRRLLHWLRCLPNREDAPAEKLLLKLLKHAEVIAAIKSEPSGADLNGDVALLLAFASKNAREALIATYGTIPGHALFAAPLAARRTLSATAFFEKFSPILMESKGKQKKKVADASERFNAMRNLLTFTTDDMDVGWQQAAFGVVRSDAIQALPELDPRWLDVALEIDEIDLICHLARSGHRAVHKYLLNRFNAKRDERPALLSTIVRIKHPDATDCMIQVLSGKDPAYLYWVLPVIPDLPPDAVPRLDELMPKLPERLADAVMPYLVELKNRITASPPP